MELPATGKGQRTRQAIIDAAYTLFIEKGYHGTSLRHIAQAAGIALGGIYNHFANKEEIFKGVVLAHHPFVKALPHIQAAEGDSAETLLRHAAHLIMAEIEKEPHIINMLFIELIELDGQHMPEVAAQMFPDVAQFLQKVQSVWTGEGKRPFFLPLLLQSFMGMIVAYFITHQIMGRMAQLVPPMTLDQHLDIYLHGLLQYEPETKNSD